MILENESEEIVDGRVLAGVPEENVLLDYHQYLMDYEI